MVSAGPSVAPAPVIVTAVAGNGKLLWPVPGAIITQYFWAGHLAIDLATETDELYPGIKSALFYKGKQLGIAPPRFASLPVHTDCLSVRSSELADGRRDRIDNAIWMRHQRAFLPWLRVKSTTRTWAFSSRTL